MTIRVFCAGFGLSLFLSVHVDAMELFTNPSFENGSGAATFSATTDFGGATALELTSISNEISGWVWEQNGLGGAAWLEDNSDFFGSDGDHLLYLDTNQSIQWQDLSGDLIAGANYTFAYNVATWERGQDLAPGDPSSGEGTILLQYNYLNTSNDLAFGDFAVSIRPAENGDSGPGALIWLSSSEVLMIPADYASAFNFSITSAGTGMLVDNVSLISVPEPRAATYFSFCLLLVVVRRTRRR
jgi:hypothetical protein